MCTTLELPDELLKRAKVAAIERGSTLRELASVALARDLGVAPAAPVAGRRARFPVFAAQRPGRLKLGTRALAKLEAGDDRKRHGLSR